jgi:hypothetical protein
LLCGSTLYSYYPKLGSDFDLLYHAAEHLLQGENPYPIARQWFPFPLFYPLPAVLLAAPFTLLPIEQARPAFDIMVGSVFAYALWRYRGNYALLALLSGSYLFAMRNGQTNPLMVGASLIPALGFLGRVLLDAARQAGARLTFQDSLLDGRLYRLDFGGRIPKDQAERWEIRREQERGLDIGHQPAQRGGTLHDNSREPHRNP